MAKQMAKAEIQAVVTVVEYLIDSEEEDYEERLEGGEDVSDHIWVSVETLQEFLEKQS